MAHTPTPRPPITQGAQAAARILTEQEANAVPDYESMRRDSEANLNLDAPLTTNHAPLSIGLDLPLGLSGEVQTMVALTQLEDIMRLRDNPHAVDAWTRVARWWLQCAQDQRAEMEPHDV